MTQQDQIDFLIEKAKETIPESFFTSPSFTIKLEYMGETIHPLIDTGAQISIISWECISRLDIHSLIDYQTEDVVSGVNSSHSILGKIHFIEFTVMDGYATIPLSLSVLQAGNNGGFDMIIGMDFLNRVGAIIDLKKREVDINGVILHLIPHKDLH